MWGPTHDSMWCHVSLFSLLEGRSSTWATAIQTLSPRTFTSWRCPTLQGNAPLPLSLPTSESCWGEDCTTTYHPCSSSMTLSPITVLLQHTALFMEVEEICIHTHTHHGNQFSKSVQTFQTVLSPVHQRTEPLWNNKLGHLPFLLLAGFWWWLRGVNLLSAVCVPQIKTSCFILSHELHGFLLCSWNEVYQAAQFTGWAKLLHHVPIHPSLSHFNLSLQYFLSKAYIHIILEVK